MSGHHPLLIVNADDFGIAEPINDGIAAAHDRGIVTSTSLMPTGEAFDHAVALARSRPKLAVGVHLVLTEHTPLSGPSAASLVEANGRFPRHAVAFARRQLRRAAAPADVRRELDAQIRRVRDTGLPITHLDGHQHVHVLPGIAAIVAELAAEHRIKAVRYPAERVRGYMLRSPRYLKRLAEQMALRLLCARSPLDRLRRSDDFVGFYFGGRLDEQNLATVIASLPRSGTVELMCHPGDERMQARDWSYAWAAERDALTSPRIRALLAARGVQLTAETGV
jgi:hopanoid biosynthesis associated protein HpnK